MRLHDILSNSNKAQLQGVYLHWFPGKEMLSVRERLLAELSGAMTDHVKVRQRFDSLSRVQKSFLISLLVREVYSGTVAEVRGSKHGGSIEDYEVETLLKSLQETGYIARSSGTGGYASEVFSIPTELGDALQRTLAVEQRRPQEMLSLRAHLGGLNGGSMPLNGELEKLCGLGGMERRLEALKDRTLQRLTRAALVEHGGILTHSVIDGEAATILPEASSGGLLNRDNWREALEGACLGTTGVLSLKDYGIDLEEEGLIVFQELVYESCLLEAQKQHECDREISLGADLMIDLDRVLEVLRGESLEVTREGNVYKKIEERIAGQFVTAHSPEFHDGSAVGHLLELSRKLHFFDAEENHIVVDRLRRWVWRKKPLIEKVQSVFEIYESEKRGLRWSFHQPALRQSFLYHLKTIRPGDWLVARPLLTAVVAQFLLRLEEDRVGAAYHERCTGDFKHETLVVSLHKLYLDLSYWVLHRLALLGVIDVGFKDGAFHSLKLSRLGGELFGVDAPAVAQGGVGSNAQLLVNPDFEVLVYPEAPQEGNWKLSLFADRVGSDRVKRYRLSRESVKRGLVAGLTREDMQRFLQEKARGGVPPNVEFSIREWTEGVEMVRLQKVHLLRAQSAAGAERVVTILEARSIPFERLNETIVMVRGAKNERAVKELQEHFRDHGLFVE